MFSSVAGPKSGGDPWASLDGRLNAPSGSPQFPTLLNGYPTSTPPNYRVRWPSIGTQPPWYVAGVDYYVGCPNITLNVVSIFTGVISGGVLTVSAMQSGTLPLIVGTVVKNTGGVVLGTINSFGTGLGGNGTYNVTGSDVPSQTMVTIPDGCDYATVNSSNFCQVVTAGTTINGWDFGQGIGWQADVQSNNITITNCKFKVLSTAPTPIQCETTSGITITYCTFDGNNGVNANDGIGSLVRLTASSNILIKYCYFLNGYSDGVDFGTGTVGFTFQYNLMYDFGMGADKLGHPDYIQCGFDSCTKYLCTFNTFYQDVAPPQFGCQGTGIGATAGLGVINCAPQFNYNTGIALPACLSNESTGGGITYCVDIATASIASGNGYDVSRNYFDPRGFKGAGAPTNTNCVQFDVAPSASGGNKLWLPNTNMNDGTNLVLNGLHLGN